MSKKAVVYTVAGDHIQLTAVSVYSLVKNYHSSQPLDILIIAGPGTFWNTKDYEDLKRFPEQLGKAQIEIYIWLPPNITKRIQRQDEQADRFPDVTLWRLFIPHYFKSYERIIYLDNDTLLLDDINQLFEQTQDSKEPISAVQDMHVFALQDIQDETDDEMKRNAQKIWHTDTYAQYVNSGVIVFNVQAYNAAQPADVIVDQINRSNFAFLDQTMLNVLFKGQIDYLPFRFNFQETSTALTDLQSQITSDKYDLMLLERSKTMVMHFTGHHAPYFHLSILDDDENLFMDYFVETKELLLKLADG